LDIKEPEPAREIRKEPPRTPAPPPPRVEKKTESTPPPPRVAKPGEFEPQQQDAVGYPEIVAQEVRAAYEAARESPSDAKKIGELGMYYYSIQEPVLASTCFVRAAQLEPTSARWHYYIANMQDLAQDTAGATEATEQAIARDAKYGPFYSRLAGLTRDADPEKAKALYKKAIQLSPSDARAYLGLGQVLEKEGDIQAAEGNYRRAISLAPDYSLAHKLLADLLDVQKRHDEAQAHKALVNAAIPPPVGSDPLMLDLVLKTRSAPFLKQLAKQLVHAGLLDQAAIALRRAIDTDPNRTNARENLGIVLAKQGRFKEAEEEFNTVLLTFPSASSMSHLGSVKAEMGEYDEAEELLRGTLNKLPNDPLTLRRYGQLLLMLGKAEESSAVFAKLVQLQPAEAGNFFDLATALAAAKKLDEAIAEYQRGQAILARREEAAGEFLGRVIVAMVKQSKVATSRSVADQIKVPDLALIGDAFASKGLKSEAASFQSPLTALADHVVTRARNGNVVEAIDLLKIVAPSDSKGVLAGALGSVLALASRFADAETAYRDALKANPDAVSFKSNIANMLIAQGKMDEAQLLLEELVRQSPNDVINIQQLAGLYTSANKYAEAEALLRTALQNPERQSRSRYLLGRLLALGGNDAEGLTLLQESVRETPKNADAHYYLGVVLFRKGDAEAMTHWRRSVEIRPTHMEARLALAGALTKAKDFESAIKTLEDGTRTNPESAENADALALILAACPDDSKRDGKRAVMLAQRACRLSGGENGVHLATLAAAYAEVGEFDKAVATQTQAINAAEMVSSDNLGEFRTRLESYNARKPYRL
jgi:superkiller protein 3